MLRKRRKIGASKPQKQLAPSSDRTANEDGTILSIVTPAILGQLEQARQTLLATGSAKNDGSHLKGRRTAEVLSVLVNRVNNQDRVMVVMLDSIRNIVNQLAEKPVYVVPRTPNPTQNVITPG